MRLVFTALLFCVACGHDHGAEAFGTYQECFDDHTMAESLPIQEAIVICCLEHPINGVTQVCGATAADCAAYLATNLSSTSATQADITAACTDYVAQKGM
ncbi:MAG TPA: hypothetical protein VIV40_42920 [Kofleriaceae bacterium]